MPILSMLLALGAIASLIVPLCVGVVALARTHDGYYQNTVRILGTMFIVTACGLAGVGAIGALLRGQQPVWPYMVITGLPVLAVAKIMHLQGIMLTER